MDRREFLAMAAVLPLLPAMELKPATLVFPPTAGEQPGCVFFDNLSTLDWSRVDGSVRYYDWMRTLLDQWKPGDLQYGEVCELFVKWPLPVTTPASLDVSGIFEDTAHSTGRMTTE
jgi:hypothetical protein